MGRRLSRWAVVLLAAWAWAAGAVAAPDGGVHPAAGQPPTEREEPILAAARTGDLERVTQLLDETPGLVHFASGGGATPLHVAVAHGNRDVVELLLARGADVNAADEDGWKALHYAHPHAPELIDLLMAHGTEPDVFTAAHTGDVAALKAMMAAEPERLNAPSPAGQAPLYWAAAQGHGGAADYLLAEWANVAAARPQVEAPIHAACRNGHHQMATLLLDYGADPNALDGNRAGPLWHAAKGGHAMVAELLLTRGADANAATSAVPESALGVAARYGHVSVVKVLLAHGANVDGVRTEAGMAPLHWAASGGHSATTEFLLQHKADPNRRTSSGDTPLHMAAGAGHERVVEVLLAGGADVNAASQRQRTPLHEAAVNGHARLAGRLQAAGARADVYTMAGLGDLDGVRALLDAEPVLLEGRGSPQGAPLSWAAPAGQQAVVKLLLERGADPNGRNGDGLTALHLAAEKGYAAVVWELIAAGADANAPGSGIPLSTPLHGAIRGGHAEVVTILLDAGARTSGVCGQDGDALQAAISARQWEVVRLLRRWSKDEGPPRG